jgi:chromosome segregation ATPase
MYNTPAGKKKGGSAMGDVEVVLERHEQRIKTLERDMADMKEVQAEIRTMNETLVTLATELKHTNEHLARHEKKIDEIDNVPKQRMQQIITAIIAALAGGLISAVIGMILN